MNRTHCKDCGLEYTKENEPRYTRKGKSYISTRCRECYNKRQARIMREKRAKTPEQAIIEFLEKNSQNVVVHKVTPKDASRMVFVLSLMVIILSVLLILK